MEQRNNESPRLWFRSERFFRSDGVWYMHTREGIVVGPYSTRFDAEIDGGRLIAQLRNTPYERARSVIRNFVMDAGGVLDYVNDPAFTDYVVSERVRSHLVNDR